MNSKKIKFDDDTIREIFGHEAAEDENIEKLKNYYFKSTIYERMKSKNSLKILVGHKGIGKSALLTINFNEDKENNRYAIMLRPDDIFEIKAEYINANEAIRSWKEGLLRIIQKKILNSIGYNEDNPHSLVSQNFFSNIINITSEWLSTKGLSANTALRDEIFHLYQDKTINVYIDDLDRGWNASSQDILRMSALLNALRDISRDYAGIHFIISVRSDVFYLIRTSDESTDKLESSLRIQ